MQISWNLPGWVSLCRSSLNALPVGVDRAEKYRSGPYRASPDHARGSLRQPVFFMTGGGCGRYLPKNIFRFDFFAKFQEDNIADFCVRVLYDNIDMQIRVLLISD